VTKSPPFLSLGEEWINLFDGDDLEEYALVERGLKSGSIGTKFNYGGKMSPRFALGKRAQKELKTLQEARTWILSAATRANIIGSKWVFHAKKDADITVMQWKACLIGPRLFTSAGCLIPLISLPHLPTLLPCCSPIAAYRKYGTPSNQFLKGLS